MNVEAAELSGTAIGKSDKTIRDWRDLNGYVIPDTIHKESTRSGVVWSNDALNKIATCHIQENQCVKGKPNLTVPFVYG